MKYAVLYDPNAIKDLEDSFNWGVINWGENAAWRWFNELEDLIEKRLSTMPKSCPLAPENEKFEIEIRHLIYGRYRVLFTIGSDRVEILYLRGPFSMNEDRRLGTTSPNCQEIAFGHGSMSGDRVGTRYIVRFPYRCSVSSKTFSKL